MFSEGQQPEKHDAVGFAGGPSAAGAGVATSALPAATASSRQVRIEIGRCRLPMEDLEQLESGTALRLREAAEAPVQIFADERLLARGQLLLLAGKFCVRITELS